MKYFISGFYQSFLPPVKTVHSFDIAKPFLFSFRDFYNFFIIKHSKVRPDCKITFTHHFNPLECFVLFPNDNIHLHFVNVV